MRVKGQAVWQRARPCIATLAREQRLQSALPPAALKAHPAARAPCACARTRGALQHRSSQQPPLTDQEPKQDQAPGTHTHARARTHTHAHAHAHAHTHTHTHTHTHSSDAPCECARDGGGLEQVDQQHHGSQRHHGTHGGHGEPQVQRGRGQACVVWAGACVHACVCVCVRVCACVCVCV
jgi:hypothetical protein